jgi:hypothetical protein
VRADLIVAFFITAEQVKTLLLAEDNDVIRAIDNSKATPAGDNHQFLAIRSSFQMGGS